MLAALRVAPAQNVTLTDNGSSFVLANGLLTATVTKSSATVTSLKYRGAEMTSGNIYYSMDGGTSYENPSGCVYSLAQNSGDLVDVSLKDVFSSNTNQPHAFDIDIHYVLRRGNSGLYTYAVLDHPSSYPATSVGEWRMVWKMYPDDLEHLYLDESRNWEMPNSYDLAHAQETGIAEIIKLTTGVRAGRYDCKYTFNVEYENAGCYGHASNVKNVGAWLVFGGYDFFNDGPTKQDLAPASGINHVHFGRNHYNGSSTIVTNGEAWRKIYGPLLLYLNYNPAGGAACWADAKTQASVEQAAWPYVWLTNTDYPPDAARGATTGRFVVTDALKSGVSGANAWVGLVDPGADWQFDSKHYQYWTRADAGGNFTLAHVRPGTYTLHAFTVGAVGEYSQPNVSVTAGATNGLGDVAWAVPHAGGYLAWEIGVPDRTAREFRHGNDYFTPYIWDLFASEFPNPLEYTVDAANPRTDWNCAHNFYGTNTAVWKWRINFNLASLPGAGSAQLTLAFCGGESSHMYLYVNNESSVFANFYPPNTGDNALLRQGVHGKYGVYTLAIPVSRLKVGTNTITLTQVNATPATGNNMMYDYLALEMPGPAPAVNCLTWTGGRSSNTWDAAGTSNWTGYATTRTFSNGTRVLFNDTGSNRPAVNLVGALTPAQVVFNSVQDYLITGSGSLAGSMALTKLGSGTLTLAATNTYTGDTVVKNGTLRVAAAVPVNFDAGDFESPLLPSDSYSSPTNSVWNWGTTPGESAGSAGLAHGNTPWAPAAAQGSQYGYFWRSGMAWQNVYFPAGAYRLSCSLLGRPGSTPANVSVRLANGGFTNTITTWAAASQTPNWSPQSASFIVTNGGTYAVIFACTRPGSASDWASAIDAVQITASTTNAPALGLPAPSRILLAADALLDLNGCAATTGFLADLSGSGGSVTNSNPGGATLALNCVAGTTVFSGTLADGGPERPLTLVKLGLGTQTLAGPVAIAGVVVVSNGTLALAGSAAPTSSPALTINRGAVLDTRGLSGGGLTLVAGQTLTGGGAVNGSVTVGDGAILAVGDSASPLAFSNSLSLSPGSITRVTVNPLPVTNALVRVAGNFAFGGTLILTTLGPSPFTAGDTLQLFNASGFSGGFANILPATPGPGLLWDSSDLAIHGVLRVIPPPGLNLVALAGDSLVLSADGGIPNAPVVLLNAPNLALPLAQWTPIATNAFDSDLRLQVIAK